MNDRTEHGQQQPTQNAHAQHDALDAPVSHALEKAQRASSENDTQTKPMHDQPLQKVSFGMLLMQRPDIDSSKTPLEAWVRHFLLMTGVYLPFDLVIGLLGSTLQTIAFWWFVIGLHMSVQVVQFRSKTHIPVVVNTYPKALKFFLMTLAWPALFL